MAIKHLQNHDSHRTMHLQKCNLALKHESLKCGENEKQLKGHFSFQK